MNQEEINQKFASAGWELDGSFYKHLIVGYTGELSILAYRQAWETEDSEFQLCDHENDLTHLTQNLGGNELTQRWSKLKSIMNRDLLELYSDYLLSSFSYTTATGLSAMTGGVVSHDKISRFLAEEELNSP